MAVSKMNLTGGYTISENTTTKLTTITFTASGTIFVPEDILCNVLLVGGGGGGGISMMTTSAFTTAGGGLAAGGGGAGGLGYGYLTLLSKNTYNIAIGTGGVGGKYQTVGGSTIPRNGLYSSIIGTNISEIAYGGGAGSGYNTVSNGSAGGSGGGVGPIAGAGTGGSATTGSGTLTYLGNVGGNASVVYGRSASGGGGAGSAAPTAATSGNGGNAYLWTNDNIYYAGGGAGGNASSSASYTNYGGGTATTTNKGGGGNGGKPNSASTGLGTSGTANTGGGGGGSSYGFIGNTAYSNYYGGNGGSGICKFIYIMPYLLYDFTAQYGTGTTTNGASITSWKDISRDQSLTGGSCVYSTSTINSYPVTSGYMNLTYGNTTTIQNNWSWFCVLRTGGTGLTGDNNLIYNSSTNALEIGLNNGNLRAGYNGVKWSVGAAYISGGTSGTWNAIINTNYILTVICSSTDNTTSATQTYTFRINGIDYTPASNTDTGYYYINNPQIGNSTTQTFMGEQMLFNTKLSLDSIQKMEQILSNQWGIPIPSKISLVPSNPLNAFYNTFGQTAYYPLVYDIKNYVTGVGVTDSTMGRAGNNTAGTANFSGDYAVTNVGTRSLSFSGGAHNNSSASYPVLPGFVCNGNISFTCWFKSSYNGGSTRIFDAGNLRLYFGGGSNDSYLVINDRYTFASNVRFNTNIWSFVAITLQGNTFNWYINEGGTGNTGTGPPTFSWTSSFTTSVIYLGHSMGDDPEFSGLLQDVRFFNGIVLNASQIQSLYNLGSARVGT